MKSGKHAKTIGGETPSGDFEPTGRDSEVLVDSTDLPKRFVDPESLQAVAHGMRTDEQRFPFPVWNPKLEKAPGVNTSAEP